MKPSFAIRKKSHRHQSGMVLVITIIVLVAMTLASLALMRSVDTNTMVAGNLAFQQAATHSADAGIEDAFNWLAANKDGTVLDNDDPNHGYSSAGLLVAQNPIAGQSWDDYWTKTLATRPPFKVNGGIGDQADNKIEYVIDRMCSTANKASSAADCMASLVATADPGSPQIPEPGIAVLKVVYYRVTVRVAGPRNTVSYVQTMFSM